MRAFKNDIFISNLLLIDLFFYFFIIMLYPSTCAHFLDSFKSSLGILKFELWRIRYLETYPLTLIFGCIWLGEDSIQELALLLECRVSI